MLCSPLKVNWSFGKRILNSEVGGDVPPKRLLTFNGLHGVISQKAAFFTTTAERTSNPTDWPVCHQPSIRSMLPHCPRHNWYTWDFDSRFYYLLISLVSIITTVYANHWTKGPTLSVRQLYKGFPDQPVTERVHPAVRLQACIWKMFGSNLGWNTFYHDWNFSCSQTGESRVRYPMRWIFKFT
jgi:hypothetical protein